MSRTLRRARLRRLAGFTPEEAALYRLEERPPAEARRYVSSGRMHHVVRPALNDPSYEALLADKWLTSRLLRSLQLPAPRTFGHFHPAIGIDEDGRPLRGAGELHELLDRHRPVRLVIKPVSGRGAEGILFADVDERGRIAVAGTTETAEALASRLASRDFEALDGAVLQERLEPHAEIAAINETALNTLRVHTLLLDDGGVEVGPSVLRVARSGAVIESLSRGALAIEVRADGRLGDGIIRPPHSDASAIASHPDTGYRFRGQTLPDWERVRAIVTAGAVALPQLRAIGWDVALTAEGPAIIEANTDWNPMVAQSHGHGWLTDTVLAELALRGVPGSFASPSLATAAQRLRRRLADAVAGKATRLLGPTPRR